jgi:hypothetical protein
MKRATANESSLDALLRRMMQQQARAASSPRARPALVATSAASAPAVSHDGGLMKPIRIGNRDYSWAELSRPDVRRQLLPQVEALFPQIKRDPAAFGLKPPAIPVVAAWTTGQYDGLSEAQLYATLPAPAEAAEGEKNVASTLTPGANAPAIDGKTAFREMATLMNTPGMITALRRRESGQTLDGAQTALIRRHDELEAANNAQALREHPPTGGTFKRTTLYNPSAIRAISNLPPVEQAHAAREQRAALRKDERWTNANHLEHAQACHEMNLLYQGEYYEGGNEPVLNDEATK